MKALDTPVLLDLLRGRSATKQLLRSSASEELATTELNLFELEVLARSGARHGKDARRAAIDRLRRKVSVLPIDERAVQCAAAMAASRLGEAPATVWLMLGAAESAGCTEWITTRESRLPGGTGRINVRVLGVSTPKNR